MIEIKELSYSRGGKTLFTKATLNIFPGNKLGLIGANGAGKSSFFSLILRESLPDSGDINIPDKYRIAHVEQEISNPMEQIINYVMQGDKQLHAVMQRIAKEETSDVPEELPSLYAQLENLGGYEAKHKGEILLTGLGFHPAQFENPVNSLSGGWQMRLNLAKALMAPSDLLLLDEPTNHLDLDTIIWLEGFLKAYEGTLVLISHDREFLDAVCDRIAAISHEEITLYTGNYSSYEQQYAAKLEQQQAQARKTEQRMAELTRFIARFKAKASKAKQAQSRVKALNKLEVIAPLYASKSIQFSFYAPNKIPDNLITVTDAIFSYGAHQVINKASFRLFAHNRIGVLGVNGAGKSTFIKLIAGENKPSSGDIVFHDDVKIAYFAQNFLSQLDTSLSPLEEYRNHFPQLTDQEIRNHLGQFAFSNDMALQSIHTMSGGEKARLALSILVQQKPNVLILDEPTNHLDLEVRESLNFALQSYEGALILVSHDRHLLESVCNEFYLMDSGKLQLFEGDLEDYRRYSQEKNRPQTSPRSENKSPSGTRKEARKQAADLRKKLQPLSNQIKSIEKEMDKLNTLKAQLENTLADPEIYHESQKDKLQSTIHEKNQTDKQLETLEESWLEISEQMESLKASE